MVGTVVTNLELKGRVLWACSYQETERETRARATTSTSEDFPYRDLSFVNLSIPSTRLVNPDSVYSDCLYRSFILFYFLSTIS